MDAAATLTLATQIHKLQTGDPGERYYAAWWLGFPGAGEAVPLLMAALTQDLDQTPNGGYPVRRNAAQALGKIGDPRAVPALITALNQGDPLLMAKAAHALGSLFDRDSDLAEQILAALLAWLTGDPPLDPTDAVEAVMETLGGLGSLTALGAIHPYADHAHPRLAHAACRALFSLTRDPHWLQRLIAGLDHPNIHIRRSAMLDLAATGEVQVAQVIQQAPLETNLKLVSLKTLAETYVRRHPQALGELKPVLDSIDALL